MNLYLKSQTNQTCVLWPRGLEVESLGSPKKRQKKKKGEVWWLPPLNPEGKIQINTDTKLDCGFPFHILMSTER